MATEPKKKAHSALFGSLDHFQAEPVDVSKDDDETARSIAHDNGFVDRGSDAEIPDESNKPSKKTKAKASPISKPLSFNDNKAVQQLAAALEAQSLAEPFLVPLSTRIKTDASQTLSRLKQQTGLNIGDIVAAGIYLVEAEVEALAKAKSD